MDVRQITPTYSVSPQICPEDVRVLADAGFGTVICNRPDAEVTGDEVSESIRAACDGAGLDFHVLPVTHSGLTAELVEDQKAIIEGAERPVLAYCRSGTRSCHVWAFGQAAEMDVEDIIQAGRDGGYDLSPLRQTLTAFAAQKG